MPVSRNGFPIFGRQALADHDVADADIGVAAAVNGLGIAYHFELDQVGTLMAKGRLVQVLADWSISRPGLFLYYSNRQHRPALLGSFIDCLLDR